MFYYIIWNYLQYVYEIIYNTCCASIIITNALSL